MVVRGSSIGSGLPQGRAALWLGSCEGGLQSMDRWAVLFGGCAGLHNAELLHVVSSTLPAPPLSIFWGQQGVPHAGTCCRT